MIFLKKSLLFFLVLSLLPCLVFAQVEDDERAAEIGDQITKVQNEITRLENRMAKEKASAKRMTFQQLIDGHKARIKKLEAELDKLTTPAVSTPEVEYVPFEVKEEAVPTAEVMAADAKRFKFEIGGGVGLFASATAIGGEVRFAMPYVFGPATTSLRLSGGLMQSGDGSRRYAPVCVDGVLNLPPECVTGVENYVGAGLNYVIVTTGRVSGTVGGEIFYGVQSEGFGGKLFGELGWGVLRTGFSPSHKGTTLIIGYRRDWGI